MEARLKAILEMESNQMQKELVAASNNLKKFERELAKATDTNQIQYLQRSIGILKADIDRMTQSANGASKAMGAVGGAMKSTQMNTQNFARVIQDLPFGFMGIQNNLTQLIPGVGAAGLAFSALTAAITFSQVGMSYWVKETKWAKAAVSDLIAFTKEFTKTAAEDATKARLLYEAANNVNIAMDGRIRAAKELKALYPSILANYSAEDIALGRAAAGYKAVTAAILENAKAQAAKNRVTELEADVQNRLFNIQKIKAITNKEQAAITVPIKRREVGGEGKALLQITERAISVDEQRLVVQNRRNDAIQKELDLIKQLRSQQSFFTQLAGGATSVQQSVIPPPEKAKTNTAPSAPKERFEMPESRGKWWRNTQTERGNDLSLLDTTKVRIEDNRALNRVLQDQIEIQNKVTESLTQSASIAEYGGMVFGQLSMAMLQGQNIGNVLAETFKNLVSQLIQAVAQAAIFAAIMSALPGGGSFGALFSSGLQGGNGGVTGILGLISGQNIELSNRRTSTGMGFRRGRR